MPDVELPQPTRLNEVTWLEPYPDALLDGIGLVPGPEALHAEAESISLAFVTALQILPARQRAVLILREVLGYRAREVAEMLDSTVDSVNSSLKRARAALQRRLPPDGGEQPAATANSAAERALVARFVRAYQAGDVDALIDLLTVDVTVSMPPIPLEYQGRDAVAQFYETVMGSGRRYDLVPTRANGQLAFGAYLHDPVSDIRRAAGLLVITVSDVHISAITRFDNNVLAWFGLPCSRQASD